MTTLTIKAEPTKNAAILKFVANQFLVTSQSFEFKNIDEAKNSPLAQQLFYLPFVKTVYIAQNFVAIEKYSIVAWADVEEAVAEQIESYLNSGKPAVILADTSKKVPITIYAESTPNPSVLKFVANKSLVSQSFEFKNIDDAKHAPLAQSLFHFPFVKEVFFNENYISIAKYDMAEWQDITLELREFIRKYIEDGKVMLKDEILNEVKKTTSSERELSEETTAYEGIEKEIVAILDQYIKPAVAGDGGNIAFKSYDENTKKVSVVLQGACSGCPSSTFTLKNGIETMLKDMLNDTEISVEALNG